MNTERHEKSPSCKIRDTVRSGIINLMDVVDQLMLGREVNIIPPEVEK